MNRKGYKRRTKRYSREIGKWAFHGALHARYSNINLRKGLDRAYGAMRWARQPRRVKNKKGERKYSEGKRPAVAEALRRLEEQSGYAT